VTLTGSTLTIAPFTLDNVPGLPASTFAVYVNGIMVRHQAQLAVDDGVAAPLALAAAFPNPAETRTLLRWTLPRAQHVDLDVLDAGGRRVRSLRSGATPAGPGTESWDVRDDGGRRVAPGIYFARLRTAGETRTTRLAVIR